MIVWLNGPFGVGKTSTAWELVRLLPQARTFDPERLGWVLRRTVGLLRPGDYQHLRLWRMGTVRFADRKARSCSTLIVSMSVLRLHYLDELLSGLRVRGHRVRHMLLDAPADVVRERIGHDEIEAAAGPWRREQLAAYELVVVDATRAMLPLPVCTTYSRGTEPRRSNSSRPGGERRRTTERTSCTTAPSPPADVTTGSR